jgi:N-acyl-D-amino-acid deacylase
MARLTRRAALKLSATAPLALLGPSSAAGDKPPVTGAGDDRLKGLDALFAEYVVKHNLPGAAAALTRNGRLVYARGFGYANVEKKTPVQPASLFRTASVSKPITAVAVMQLAEKKLVKLDAPVLDYVSVKPLLPPKTKQDPRWKRVTVRHCLQHTAGFDREKSLDPCTDTWEVAKALGVSPPLAPAQVVRYSLGRPIEHEPGERYVYSNLGYLLLGRVIEAAAKSTYAEYVKKKVFAPLGVTAPQLARGTPPTRPKGEVSYYDANGYTGTGLYPPTAGQKVPTPDGGMNVEAFEAHGGWVASAVDLVRFAAAFDDPAACPLLSEESIREMWARPTGAAGEENGKPSATYYGCGWSVRPVGRQGRVNAWHYGRVSGTSSVVVHRNDGFAWAVLFNTDFLPGGKKEPAAVAEAVHPVVDAVTEWPDADQFEKLLK